MYIDDEPVGGQKEANFSFPVTRFLPVIGPEPAKVGRPNVKRQRSREFASSVLDKFTEALNTLRMVGPFRRPPERRYEYQGPIADRVDAEGSYVVNALIEDAFRRRRRGHLIKAVNRWLQAVARVRLSKVRRLSRNARLFEIRLKDADSGRWANFADVGFGIGQALPVFVEGLRTPENGLFMVQEPEIHLHPDAQLRIADFLVSLAEAGRRVIAETHSEHILLRVRRHLVRSQKADGKPGRLRPQDVAVVYVDKKSDGTSHARSLLIDELAQIDNWPTGFLEEATQERLAILKEMGRAKEGIS